MNNLLSQAHAADIIDQEAGRELLIHDLRIDKMFQLIETSRIIYKSCGKRSFDELKRKHQFTDDLIYFALAELRASGLLEDCAGGHFAGLSRREETKRTAFFCQIGQKKTSRRKKVSALLIGLSR